MELRFNSIFMDFQKMIKKIALSYFQKLYQKIFERLPTKMQLKENLKPVWKSPSERPENPIKNFVEICFLVESFENLHFCSIIEYQIYSLISSVFQTIFG